MTSEVEVTITSESATSSHITPIQTASSEGTTTPTLTVVYGTSGEIETPNLPFDYNSSATPSQTVVHTTSEGFTETSPTAMGEVFSKPTPTPSNSSSSNGKIM